MDLQKFVVGFVMFGLFTIALIGLAIQFSIDNNSVVDVADDAQIVSLSSRTGQNLSGFDTAAETTTASIINSSIAAGGQTTQTGGQFAITPSVAVGTGKNIIEVGYYRIFGSDSGFGIFLITFFAVIAFIGGLMIWKAWVGRSPSD